MPELPDVEVFRRTIARTSLNRRIERVHVPDTDLLESCSRPKLAAALTNHQLTATHRRGKYLCIESSAGPLLVLHFGMTGAVERTRRDDEDPPYTRLRLDFHGPAKSLAYTNKRKLGLITLTDSLDDLAEKKDLGRDALEVDLPHFRGLLDDRRGTIKNLLMDQSTIAGIGNVYADEALYHAGIRPSARCRKLTDDQVADLHRALRRVLNTAIRKHANPDQMPRSWLLPHRDKKGRCPRHDRRWRITKVGGRTTYHCPRCQPAR